MKQKRSKYNGSISHKLAIIHLIGQAHTAYRDDARRRDIADWMGVSKVTSTRHIRKLMEEGYLEEIRETWRTSAEVCTYKLTPMSDKLYQGGETRQHYYMYCQRVMRVIV